MFSSLLTLVVVSLSGVMSPGPMFAVTVARSYKSPWSGALVSLGHAVIEVPLILLIYSGFGAFFQITIVQILLSVIGGGMIVWMGIGMFRGRSQVVDEGKEVGTSAFVAGILTAALNPFFLLWWATVGSLLISGFAPFGTPGLVIFTIAHWSCDLIWMSFVSILVYKTHGLWGRRFQEWTFIICSLLLLGFGGWYLYSGVRLLASGL
jgi:threonine/homoserine/homoserine lactone efflux protein